MSGRAGELEETISPAAPTAPSGGRAPARKDRLPNDVLLLVAAQLSRRWHFKTLAALISTCCSNYTLLLPFLYRTFLLTDKSKAFLNDLLNEALDRLPSLELDSDAAERLSYGTAFQRGTTLPTPRTELEMRASWIELLIVHESTAQGCEGYRRESWDPWEEVTDPVVPLYPPPELPVLLPGTKMLSISSELNQYAAAAWLAWRSSPPPAGEADFKGYVMTVRALQFWTRVSTPICLHFACPTGARITGAEMYAQSNGIKQALQTFDGAEQNLMCHNVVLAPRALYPLVSGENHLRECRRCNGMAEPYWDLLEYDWRSKPAAKLVLHGTSTGHGIHNTDEERLQTSVIDFDVDDVPMSSELAKTIWLSTRRLANPYPGLRGTARGFPFYSEYIPWKSAYEIIEHRFICIPDSKPCAESICGFCKGDW